MIIEEEGRIRAVPVDKAPAGRPRCDALVILEVALRRLGYSMIYAALAVERVYRKGESIVVIDYLGCRVETKSLTCEQIDEMIRDRRNERLYT